MPHETANFVCLFETLFGHFMRRIPVPLNNVTIRIIFILAIP